jgi:hypothetical protein
MRPFALILALSFVPSFSQASVLARCWNPLVMDAGYSVLVEKDDTTDQMTASLSEISEATATLLGTGRVEKLDMGGPEFSYQNLNLKLTISRVAPTVGSSGLPNFSAVIESNLLSTQPWATDWKNLLCEVAADELTPPNVGGGVTCMAYFSGVAYEPISNSCMRMGMSGCSSPFEFQTVTACEEAFTTKR